MNRWLRPQQVKSIAAGTLMGMAACVVAPNAWAGDTLLHSFSGGSDGADPNAVVDVGGTLYGTTRFGGSTNCPSGCGTVFSYSTATKIYEQVYAFTGDIHASHDGAEPGGGLVQVGKELYGTTNQGGTHNLGTVFAIDLPTGKERVLYSFAGTTGGGSDGASPSSGLLKVVVEGVTTLYGTTTAGGVGYGTVFDIIPGSRGDYIVHRFLGGTADGSDPQAGLIDLGGVLYGTTSAGGTYSGGTIFSLTLSGTETVLHSFDSVLDGSYPQAALFDLSGIFYGTAADGGQFGSGTLYSINPEKTGSFTNLHSFIEFANDGATPDSALINVKGTLYGVSIEGGTVGDGNVFAYNAKPGVVSVYSFTGGTGDGSSPGGNLIAVNGLFYGTTSAGGADREGTLYSLPVP